MGLVHSTCDHFTAGLVVQVLTVFSLLRTSLCSFASVPQASVCHTQLCFHRPFIPPPSSEHLRAFPPSFRLLVCLPSPAPSRHTGLAPSTGPSIHPFLRLAVAHTFVSARHPSGCGIRWLARCSPALQSTARRRSPLPAAARASVGPRTSRRLHELPPPRGRRLCSAAPRGPAVATAAGRAGVQGRAGRGARGGAGRPRRRGPG